MAERTIEIFTAGCPCCDEAVETVQQLACDNCEVVIHDIAEGCETNECRRKAEQYDIKRVPAVVVDGQLADCCATDGVDPEVLADMGVGQG